MARARDARGEQPRGHGEDADDPREQAAASQRRGESFVAQRQVHPDGEHQHREADFPQKRDRAVGWVHRVEHRGTDEDAGEDLADHDGHEPASGDAEQRPAEPGKHDHGQGSKAHSEAAYGTRLMRLGAGGREGDLLQPQGPVACFGQGRVVGDEQHPAFDALAQDVVQDAMRELGIEVGCRLVEDQKAGF